MANKAAIQGIILGWMEEFSFEALDAAAQEQVLQVMSSEEYNELHQLNRVLKENTRSRQTVPQGDTKELLLQRFRNHHRQKEPVRPEKIQSLKIFRWAAVLMLTVIAAGAGYIAGRAGKDTGAMAVVRDTVYRERIVEAPVKATDKKQTLPVIAVAKRRPADHKQHPGHVDKDRRAVETGLPQVQDDDLVFPVSGYETAAVAPKGNSFRDDSALRKYPFVSL